jgi:hypothetical protein
MLASRAVAAQAVAKVDPRALALGGGYVAVADGWAALQWNPAGLWVSGRNEAAASFGNVPLEAGPWVGSLRTAAGLEAAVDPADAAATLSSSSAGLAGERAMGVYVASTRFGGAFQEITYVDEVSRLQGDDVAVDMASLRTREYQFSAALPLLEGRMALGVSARIVQASGRFQAPPLPALPASDLTAGGLLATAREAEVAAEQTVGAFDVGVLVMPTAKLRLGGVVKNINAPTIEGEPEGSWRLPRQIRVGGLLLPHPAVKMTLDLDLSTDSFVEGGRQRRELGGGLELNAEVVAVRGGLIVDMNAVERRATYTFGLGVNGEVLRMDLAGSWAPQRDGFGWIGAVAAEF